MHAPPADAAGEPRTCAALSEALEEPLPGTAAVAGTWLCLEQRGPWGHNAPLQSHLDTTIGKALSERAEASGVRLQLIRRPGKHPDAVPGTPRRVYVAHTLPGRSWLRTIDVTDPAELLELDFERIAHGLHDGWGRPVAEPLLLVCTNGRRDQCCALRGRALVADIGDRHRDFVWETTHTGGHRFAPAVVLLPSGYTYGRMDARGSDAVLSAATSGKVVLDQCRGRSSWSRPGQAAEIAVREASGEYLLDALDVDPRHGDSEHGGAMRVVHRDGRQWTVTVRAEELDPARQNSCGKAAVRPMAFVAESVRPLTPIAGVDGRQ